MKIPDYLIVHAQAVLNNDNMFNHTDEMLEEIDRKIQVLKGEIEKLVIEKNEIINEKSLIEEDLNQMREWLLTIPENQNSIKLRHRYNSLL